MEYVEEVLEIFCFIIIIGSSWLFDFSLSSQRVVRGFKIWSSLL